MPQIIDYAGRFEQIRGAVFALTLREGAHVLTMARVAAEMGVSRSTLCRVLADAGALPWLGRELADRRERTRRLLHGPQHRADEPAWQAYFAELAWLLPLDEVSAELAIVRWRLSEAYGAGDRRLREADASRAEALDDLVTRLVGASDLEAGESEAAEAHLRVLVDGVTVRVCREQLTPGHARTVLSSYVAGLVDGPGRLVA
jgi:AraC-like DNA-binding protein